MLASGWSQRARRDVLQDAAHIPNQQEMRAGMSPTAKMHGAGNREAETARGPSFTSSGPLANIWLRTLLVKRS